VLTNTPTCTTELCFWFFVVNAGPKQADWFHSRYFRAWIVGSAVAVLYMPLVTILTRSDPLKVPFHSLLILIETVC